AVDILHRHRDVGEPRLVHHPLAVRRIAGAVEMQELEHEPVAPEVDGRHGDGWLEPQEAVGVLVGRLDLALERETEQLLVETTGTLEVGDALAHVVERDVVGHGRSLRARVGGGRGGYQSHMADERTDKISDATREADRREARVRGHADRSPTPEEERWAEREKVDPEAARQAKEAAERGARQRGEG